MPRRCAKKGLASWASALLAKLGQQSPPPYTISLIGSPSKPHLILFSSAHCLIFIVLLVLRPPPAASRVSLYKLFCDGRRSLKHSAKSPKALESSSPTPPACCLRHGAHQLSAHPIQAWVEREGRAGCDGARQRQLAHAFIKVPSPNLKPYCPAPSALASIQIIVLRVCA